MSVLRFAALLLLAGCASSVPTVIEKPVVIERERTIALPPDLLSDCLGAPPALEAGATNGDLLMSWQGWQSFAACLQSRLERIRELQPVHQ